MVVLSVVLRRSLWSKRELSWASRSVALVDSNYGSSARGCRVPEIEAQVLTQTPGPAAALACLPHLVILEAITILVIFLI